MNSKRGAKRSNLLKNSLILLKMTAYFSLIKSPDCIGRCNLSDLRLSGSLQDFHTIQRPQQQVSGVLPVAYLPKMKIKPSMSTCLKRNAPLLWALCQASPRKLSSWDHFKAFESKYSPERRSVELKDSNSKLKRQKKITRLLANKQTSTNTRH